VLLTGAGLLLRTFLNLTSTPPGFDSTGVLTLHMVVANADESRALEQRVARIPGVQAVGFISLLPLQQSGWYGNFSIAGGSASGSAEFRYVTSGYFEAMGIPVRSGRTLTDRDTSDAPKVLLVNDALARKYFPRGDALGSELTGRGIIVGIVADVRQASLDRAAVPEIYYPVAQNFAQLRSAGSSMVVRSPLAPDALMGTIRVAIREVNPNLATFRVQPLDRVIGQSLGARKLYLWLLGIFATMATLLAAAGIYGVVAYLVTLRTREFGIRIALGADKSRVLGLVLGHGGNLVAAGIAMGAAGALALTRLLTSVLYGVTTTDLSTFIATAIVLSAVALGACVVPARRAARVDPAVALRAE
jgi:putative ABC transport system permease protein